jgi:hypothetical protein
MHKSGNSSLRDYGEYITSALQTEAGHLSIGRGARLGGYDCEHIKTCCIAAGVPVIDSRMVPFEDVVRLGEEASAPPYHALSFAPLGVVAQAYRAAGAEVFNLPDPAGPADKE